MSFEDERRAIEGRFAANFTALAIKWENQPFDIVNDTAYVALTILTGAGHQASLGGASALQRYAGVIQIDIYVPEDTGTKVAKQHADTIESIFRQVQFSAGSSGTIFTRTPSIKTLGTMAGSQRAESGWHRTVVSVDYHRDKIN